MIPGRTGHRVVIGHWIETVDCSGKLESVSRFYSTGMSNAERIDVLNRWGEAYVFFGAEEQVLGGFDPAAVDYLVPA